MNESYTRRQVEREAGNVGNVERGTQSGTQRHTETPVLSPLLMDPGDGGDAWGAVSLNTARRSGRGRGRACRVGGACRRGGASAALAGAHDHVRQLLHLGLAAHVVHDGQWLQRLRHAARRRRRARVVLVVQGQDLRAGSGPGVVGGMSPPAPCRPTPPPLPPSHLGRLGAQSRPLRSCRSCPVFGLCLAGGLWTPASCSPTLSGSLSFRPPRLPHAPRHSASVETRVSPDIRLPLRPVSTCSDLVSIPSDRFPGLSPPLSWPVPLCLYLFVSLHSLGPCLLPSPWPDAPCCTACPGSKCRGRAPGRS